MYTGHGMAWMTVWRLVTVPYKFIICLTHQWIVQYLLHGQTTDAATCHPTSCLLVYFMVVECWHAVHTAQCGFHCYCVTHPWCLLPRSLRHDLSLSAVQQTDSSNLIATTMHACLKVTFMAHSIPPNLGRPSSDGGRSRSRMGLQLPNWHFQFHYLHYSMHHW